MKRAPLPPNTALRSAPNLSIQPHQSTSTSQVLGGVRNAELAQLLAVTDRAALVRAARPTHLRTLRPLLRIDAPPPSRRSTPNSPRGSSLGVPLVGTVSTPRSLRSRYTTWLQERKASARCAAAQGMSRFRVPPPASAPASSIRNPSSYPALQARRLEDIPFPFPYGQMLSFMLFCFGILYPIVTSLWVRARPGTTATVSYHAVVTPPLARYQAFFAWRPRPPHSCRWGTPACTHGQHRCSHSSRCSCSLGFTRWRENSRIPSHIHPTTSRRA